MPAPFADKADYLADNHSTTMYPSNIPSLCVVDPQNAAMAAIKILALSNRKLQNQAERHIQEVKESF